MHRLSMIVNSFGEIKAYHYNHYKCNHYNAKGKGKFNLKLFFLFFFGSQISFLGLGGCFKVWYDGKRETVSRCALMKKSKFTTEDCDMREIWHDHH